jgi:hypothetical protein
MRANKVKVYSCKCHGHPYKVCHKCGCHYCPTYWRSCPRCIRIECGQGAAIAAIRDPVIRARNANR